MEGTSSALCMFKDFVHALQTFLQCSSCGVAWKHLASPTCGRCANSKVPQVAPPAETGHTSGKFVNRRFSYVLTALFD